MSKVIEGVPESISREDYLRLIASAGFDVNELRSLKFGYDGIYAEVIDRDNAGQPRYEGEAVAGESGTVINTVYIPVQDEEPGR
ncbi:hypothetical protein [Jiangella asiatica]|uniref:Uncharacterized protein n=1 Tax=Jiangella asiatica TaxID=2530372 RepID=A0A4R5CYA0_9ACTN|nr:hypothetical protein [Jiangella asiatica]TDE02833.1 hypothetical protein E1269_21315 [Jiangella asiatica]